MKQSILKSVFGAGILIGAGLTAIAGPLQRADVPAEPIWVLHADCDALRRTAVGQFLLAEMDKPDAQAKLAIFQTMFDFDPRTQLHGLTLYGSGMTPEDGVLLVYAAFDPERLASLAKAAKDSQHVAYKKHVIYNWIDEKKPEQNGVKARTYAAIKGSQVVVFAQQEARVAQALDVLDRAAANLAGSGVFPRLGAAGGNSFIVAAARKLDFPDATPNAAILRLVKLMRLQIGEAKGQISASLSLETNDEDVAKQAASVVQGVLALAKLQKARPEAGRLADALAIKQDGASVVAALAMPAADAINLLKSAAEKQTQKKSE